MPSILDCPRHANGATIRANMVAGFVTAIQSAVMAIETEFGRAAARNYVQKKGAVTITGAKTFQDGAAFGTGNIAGTGLVRLPNLGAVKWRKADNSGDLGMALNASNHVAMDAVIDFAAGQTFGAFSYPDATTTTKGIVQIDSVGGLVVAAGVVGQQHRDQQDGGAREHRDHGGYTLVGLKRQDELTRRIQDKRAKAAKKAKKVVEMKKKEDAA